MRVFRNLSCLVPGTKRPYLEISRFLEFTRKWELGGTDRLKHGLERQVFLAPLRQIETNTG